ncbi:adenylate/guanylate cyclase domain-containing protein [Lutimaribacter marinistellae]|uniref:Adenylate/guanylate cyclase domain-containing protein n=1 Tax=Lutimaribacter marinistellae TaxID=1820329 RepID=A0ABV7TK52_9RHOB
MKSFADSAMCRADTEAEQLIGFIRIVVSVMLGVSIIILAKNPSDQNIGSMPSVTLALIVVSTYFALGCLSIVVAQTQLMRTWIPWIFGFLDVVLVLSNLYYSARLHDSGAHVILSSPASLFAVLVFVSQLFRFRIFLQASLTVSLVAGLGIMIFSTPYAVLKPAEIDFLVGNFDLASNFIRLVIFSAIGCVCIVAVWRTRKLVWSVSWQSEIERNTAPFLPQELRQNLSDERLALLKHGRSVTVVIAFVDIRNFTAISDRIGPERTTQLLSAFRERVVEIVQEHGGVIEKFIGDGVLIVFGLSGPINLAARRALAAAEHLSNVLSSGRIHGLEPDHSTADTVVALHTGNAIAGVVGDSRHLEFGVFGAVVNEAARIEGIAKSLDMRIVASEAVFETSETNPEDWLDLGATKLRGRPEQIRLYGVSS